MHLLIWRRKKSSTSSTSASVSRWTLIADCWCLSFATWTRKILSSWAEMTQLSKKARERKLTPEEMEGGTFTITNLGGIGGTGFSPIVNHPAVAILGLSCSRMAPEWGNNKFEPRLILPLSLSYDHRLIDGAA